MSCAIAALDQFFGSTACRCANDFTSAPLRSRVALRFVLACVDTTTRPQHMKQRVWSRGPPRRRGTCSTINGVWPKTGRDLSRLNAHPCFACACVCTRRLLFFRDCVLNCCRPHLPNPLSFSLHLLRKLIFRPALTSTVPSDNRRPPTFCCHTLSSSSTLIHTLLRSQEHHDHLTASAKALW